MRIRCVPVTHCIWPSSSFRFEIGWLFRMRRQQHPTSTTIRHNNGIFICCYLLDHQHWHCVCAVHRSLCDSGDSKANWPKIKSSTITSFRCFCFWWMHLSVLSLFFLIFIITIAFKRLTVTASAMINSSFAQKLLESKSIGFFFFGFRKTLRSLINSNWV